MTANDTRRIVKRRIKAAGLSGKLSPHSFRLTTFTDRSSQGVPREDLRYLLGHADPRTTALYAQSDDERAQDTVDKMTL